MLEKTKRFYKEHKAIILTIGGGVVLATAGVLLNQKISGNRALAISQAASDAAAQTQYSIEEEEARKFLESIGGKIINGSCFATKEVATKFIEEMEANSYQLAIFDPQEAAIFISRT